MWSGCQRSCSKVCLPLYRHGGIIQTSTRGFFADSSSSASTNDRESTVPGDENPSSKTTRHMRLKINQRDFIIDILGASTTKREAKSYLSRFQSDSRSSEFNQQRQQDCRTADNTVNLGNLFSLPVVSGLLDTKLNVTESIHEHHIAIVLLRASDKLSDEVLHGVTRTLSQLSQLGMQPVVVLDLRDHLSVAERWSSATAKHNGQEAQTRSRMFKQADRLVDALELHLNQRAYRIDYLFKGNQFWVNYLDVKRGRVTPDVENLHLLKQCFDTNVIPVILPVARTKFSKMRSIETKQAVIALSRALAGTAKFQPSQKTIQEHVSSLNAEQDLLHCSVDRIVLLDSVGGIPEGPSFEKAHIFINLEQEYENIRDELNMMHNLNSIDARRNTYQIQTTAGRHMKNLSLVRRALKFLPPSSSALITSPEAVARYEYSSTQFETMDVGTRPQKNILIHNILTDKPFRSSSLPSSRLTIATGESLTDRTNLSATFLKHGMPLTLVPDPRSQPWKPPTSDAQMLSLSDPRLDIRRLVHLIEDSFGRPLDQADYFSRIAPSLAGIIIAGAYEGGAILTWERPSSAPVDDPTRLVPYLDKFAVLRRSQGSGGVADIVFSAMVRECFPQGVCWRSRSDNPVNKWYFERARGTCRLAPKDKKDSSAQSWTMFWTTEGVQEQKFRDYEEVCRSINSSWADGKVNLD